jgi:zinc/manganese transport system substrate-binding protein
MRLLASLFLAVMAMLPSAAFAAVKVVATLPSLAAISREVGGADVEVESLLPANIDPHFADARPSLVVTLNRADLVVANGLELEAGWLPPLLHQARNPRVAVGTPGYLDASTVVRRLDIPQGAVDRAQGDVHPGGNPHFLYDPRAGAAIARAIGARLGQIDPTHAAAYTQRAQAVAHELETFASSEAARFAAIDATQRQVVTYHKSLVYLCDWLGLTSPIQVEPRPGVAPDPAHVARVLSRLRQLPHKVILQEEFYPTNTSQTLAQLSQGHLVSLQGGARFAQNQRYIDHVRAISSAVHDALTR